MREIILIDTIHDAFREIMERNNFVVKDASALSREDILKICQSAEGIVVRSRFPVNREFIEKAGNIRFIARAGAGMENIDVDYAESRNITCIKAPEGNRSAVGEHALGMLLALMNKLCIADREVRRGLWKRESNRSHELEGKTIALIGFGNMGTAFAEKLRGLSMNIIACDKYIKIDTERYPFVKQAGMDEVFDEADIISLHVPLTGETEFMVNSDFISRCRKNIYIINTARGKNVRTADLVEALKSGKVAGACLDVIEYEDSSFEHLGRDMPEEWQYLINSDKVLLTPHVAGWSFESHLRISEVLAQKILNLYES